MQLLVLALLRSLIDQRMAEWLRKAAEPPGGEGDPGRVVQDRRRLSTPQVHSPRGRSSVQAEYTGAKTRKTCPET